MGLVGLIGVSLVNLMMHSSSLQYIISIAGIFIFAGLTAYDTQRLKSLYVELGADPAWQEKTAIMGALSLYLNFLNLFLNMLNLFGVRKR